LAQSRALRVAVIGASAAGIELAMAIQHRLPTSSVTLVTEGASVADRDTSAVQQRVVKALKQRNITVLADMAVSIQAGEVALASGARLACDIPVITIGAQAPAWLIDSGLALDPQGFIAVDA
jgi:NADH dehydrogenase FAD-containing subunit